MTCGETYGMGRTPAPDLGIGVWSECIARRQAVYQSFCKSHLLALALSRLTASEETALTHEGAVFARTV